VGSVNSSTWGQETYLHPAVAAVLLLAIGLIFVLPRKQVMVLIIAGGLLIPMDEVVVAGPFHFQVLRILILAGWIRTVVSPLKSRQSSFRGINVIDKLVICYGLIDAVDYVLLWDGSGEAFVNRFGALYTVLGIYFLFRLLIVDDEDVTAAITALAYVSAVIAVVMVIEQATGRNPYGFLGGSRGWTRESLMIRAEKFRAMGPFMHPILAGTFGAITLPLFIGLWLKRGKRNLAVVIGVLSATTIVLESASSTPMMAYALGLLALALWRMRKRMRVLRWGLALGLIALHLVMKAPAWALIQRVDLTGGSSSYHRYYLLDSFIRHVGDWWLLGIKDTNSWGVDMWDHANQYVAVGTASGLVPLVVFISIIVFAFKYVGIAVKRVEGEYRKGLLPWALGAALFANVVAFFGIAYHDQTVLVWWVLLAMISTLATAPERQEVTEDVTANPDTGDLARAGMVDHALFS
jgi:hypothetical protein